MLRPPTLRREPGYLPGIGVDPDESTSSLSGENFSTVSGRPSRGDIQPRVELQTNHAQLKPCVVLCNSVPGHQ